VTASSIREAVTAVLHCGDEVFMVRRSPALTSFPGYWAFPGGKVDAEDSLPPKRGHAFARDIEPQHFEALVRELREEISFDLDAALAAGDVLDLHLFGTALTPPIVPVRFNTLFYRVHLKTRPAITLDTGEVDQCRWASPQALMDEFRDGQLLLAPPTSASLALFEGGGGRESANVALEEFHKDRIAVIEPIHRLRNLPVRSNTLPPATHTNCFLIGDDGANRILVDPSPMNLAELDALHARVRDFGITQILLTHHHPDHREHADELARRLGIGLAMSRDSAERIAAGTPKFFDGLTLQLLADGDVVSHWLGRPVRVLAVPGHDEGQIALMPDDRAWCIVGDLIQGVGTVVIHKPEGNMKRYFESLRRIIALDPKIILPSHGMAMGTTYRLQETLKHREQRESTVLELHRAGQSLEQMLDLIYRDVDPRLRPYARMNIEAHLDKLREDGVLA
jgi:glyoxylase-like metal-dependent hydrolase (beta-lactamase superfamily II)/8-oxo-dGTP pyrophosphatase MutT (NUDIX family)